MTILGTVEIGGTKTDIALGSSPDNMTTPHRVHTTDPMTTLDEVVAYFRSNPVDAIGVASFGPLDLDPGSPRYGTMLATPKAGWSGADVLGAIEKGAGVPVGIDTDVNGAALGEGCWGATTGMANHAYMTVGTGIGVGVVVSGHILQGERHPEVGHITVSRQPGDRYHGSCPYHRDCLEGMASGPALEARFGPPETWAGMDPVVELAAHYVAQGLRNLVYTVSPERIVVGGGVSTLPHFHDRLRFALERDLGDYPLQPDPELLVAKPGLGSLSGLAGGLVLAEKGADR